MNQPKRFTLSAALIFVAGLITAPFAAKESAAAQGQPQPELGPIDVAPVAADASEFSGYISN